VPSPPLPAVFVVHVWAEDGQFRARIRRTTGLDTVRTVSISDIATIGEQLALWLRDVAEADDTPRSAPAPSDHYGRFG
jgi:hypothetical protein